MHSGPDSTPNFSTCIPPGFLAPDTVETLIDGLDFFDCVPDGATVRKLYGNLMFLRGWRRSRAGFPPRSVPLHYRQGSHRLGNCGAAPSRRLAEDEVMDDYLLTNAQLLPFLQPHLA